MSIFHSPFKLIKVYKTRTSNEAQRLHAYGDVQWYVSKEGRDAYNALSTTVDKTEFYYRYLCALAKKNGEKVEEYSGPFRDSKQGLYSETSLNLARIAFLLATEIDGASFAYSAYPDILSPEKNPFVKYAINGLAKISFRNELLAIILAERGQAVPDDPRQLYQVLSRPGDATYRLERAVIALDKDWLDSVYNYDIRSTYSTIEEGE